MRRRRPDLAGRTAVRVVVGALAGEAVAGLPAAASTTTTAGGGVDAGVRAGVSAGVSAGVFSRRRVRGAAAAPWAGEFTTEAAFCLRRAALVGSRRLITCVRYVPASAQRAPAERTEDDASSCLDEPGNSERELPPATHPGDVHQPPAESESEHEGAHGRGTAEG